MTETQNNNTKKILQFWSGGADSTYLLLQNLRCGYDVSTVYIEIQNNVEKTQREHKAMTALLQDIYIFCKALNLKLPYQIEDSSIIINAPYFNPKAPQQVTFAAFALMLGLGFDEVHLGVVDGDSAKDTPLFDGFRQAYLSSVLFEDGDQPCPKILMPLKDVNKDVIYITLASYDKLYGTQFLRHITCCEGTRESTCIEHDVCGNHKGYCEPCSKQIEVLERIGLAPKVKYKKLKEKKRKKPIIVKATTV